MEFYVEYDLFDPQLGINHETPGYIDVQRLNP